MSAKARPATWLPEAAPTVIVLAPAPPGVTGIGYESILGGRSIVSDVPDGDDRHLVVIGRGGLDRLTILAAKHPGGHHIAIVPDDCWRVRMAALARFADMDCAMSTALLRPTVTQQHRLSLMLRALDCLKGMEGEKPTLRHIAETILYPGFDPGRAIEWKCSSERRQMQRLMHGAIHLMQGGYRGLLSGTNGRAGRSNSADAVNQLPGGENIERGRRPKYK